MKEEDKATTRPRHRGMPSEEGDLNVAEEVYVPDYCMQDFGFPENTRASGSRRGAGLSRARFAKTKRG